MSLNEGSAGAGLQISFKCIGFLAVIKSEVILDTPGFIFVCMKHLSGIVFFHGSHLTTALATATNAIFDTNYTAADIHHILKR